MQSWAPLSCSLFAAPMLLSQGLASSGRLSLSSFLLGLTILAFPSQKTQLPPLCSPTPIFTPVLLSHSLPGCPTCAQSTNSLNSTMHVFRNVHLIISEIRMSPRGQSQCSYCSLNLRDLGHKMLPSLQLRYELCWLKYFKLNEFKPIAF